MTGSPFQGGDFGALIERFVRKQASIDDVIKHEQFQRELKGFCRSYGFSCFNGAYSVEDLGQDASMKVRRSAKRLQTPDNILDEQGFRGWLYVVVQTTYFSKDKQLNRARRLKLTPCEDPEAELAATASYDNPDGKYFLNLYLEFIKSYPEKRQRAIELNLESFSLRQITKILNAEGGPQVSYGTVGNWVNASLKAFKESLVARSLERQKRFYGGGTGT